jgi:two-component system, OmpR family, phosphate regulon sensor histidine kinase PhoR
MSNKLTPEWLARVSALTISLVFWFFVLILWSANKSHFANSMFWIAPIFLFITSYTLVRTLSQHYIHSRINIIYKNILAIRSGGANKPALKADHKQDALEIVENEVENWVKEQQKSTAHNEELESYRREFVGNVSHELKTPIFNMQGLLQTLLDGGLDDERIRYNYVERAVKNADRLQTILEDLSTIAQLESGNWIPESTSFDIIKLCEEVFAELETKAHAKNINLRIKVPKSDSILVVGDKSNIRQVLTNLIENAIKYGNEDGYVRFSAFNMDMVWMIQITDNGIGIADEHLKHLFDRFYRVDKSRSREQGGSGLGLSIVKHIIEAHGHSISASSIIGTGSTFTFHLDKG